jgi:hypothetical protein
MERRSFITALAGLPLIGVAVAKQKKGWTAIRSSAVDVSTPVSGTAIDMKGYEGVMLIGPEIIEYEVKTDGSLGCVRRVGP